MNTTTNMRKEKRIPIMTMIAIMTMRIMGLVRLQHMARTRAPKKIHKHKHKHKRKSKTNSTQALEHSSGVSSLGFQREGEVIEERFAQFMSMVIRNFAANIYRAKGIINISGNPNKLVFHGVHELFDSSNETPWGKDDKKTNKLVFIGKDLPRDILVNGFGYCLEECETKNFMEETS